ncbi:pit accessory protein [Luteolibacter yonseiensis]|uniref:Pit accessory protein n=1 Tax=Luteolibacter yonseiensis TaxID=1144680 RepID=A0A934R441_9BACT|nr:pit accessory protein [Luteolibacter yonseiensis]MBK1816761.1 pit accessory protein [Luteolibacter yonseiensis]
MISLAKLFGKSDRFFELLASSAKSAHQSIEALARLLQESNGDISLADLAVARRNEKKTAEIISEELVKVFVTALDREDIEALSKALYRIPKTVEKFGERYEIMHHLVKAKDFAPQMAIAQEAALVVVRMVDMLSKSPRLEDIKAENDKMQELEGRADQLVVGYLKEIYSGSMDPIEAMAKRDLYDLLEKVIDRCRDAGNVVSQIVLKNS